LLEEVIDYDFHLRPEKCEFLKSTRYDDLLTNQRSYHPDSQQIAALAVMCLPAYVQILTSSRI
uniref:Cyclin_C domain-containing protein n=1 Tax=Hymenolepis diminuta TaxID=6216 RepID=A0A0R3SP08_HYMDI